MCSAARGQVLIPWPNRLRDGRYDFRGEHQLPLSEPEKHNAIHGLVRWASWQPSAVEPDRLTMAHVLYPRPGYPFLLDLEVTYELSDDGLRVELAIRNAGDVEAPVGAGQHPYLLPLGALDDAVLRVPARSAIVTDDRQIPTGSVPVDGGEHDFRAGRPVGATRLDTAFCELERDGDGRSWLRLEEPSRSVGVWLDHHLPYVMVFTGDTLPDPAARRRSLGVEPMSCPPNAFQTGRDVVRLEPEQTWRAAWGIAVNDHGSTEPRSTST
jgi:aldose 1-epimerase